MLQLIIAVILLISLIIYALMGGADFGGGIWNMLSAGPRAQKQREAIAEAIGPIWEANHVWLILVIVILFTGFPLAFAMMMTALNIPMTVVLIGIVLRGSAFVFRKYESRPRVARRLWNTLFGLSSLMTPFFQGIILGALTTGRIRVENNRVITGFFAGWTTPFAVCCGLFAACLFAFLAAAYLTVDTKGQPELQEDFRRRALWSGAALAPVALLVFLTSKTGAPLMHEGLTRWWAPVLLAWTSLFAIIALGALWFRKYALARIAAIGQVTMILLGWCVAQFPYFIAPDVTVGDAAAPQATLQVLIVALGLGAIVLFPSLIYLFHVFKGNRPVHGH
jgi:cytochrome d ubiquinol oxidase subunit II